jgi:hypothetical protein
MHLGEEMQFDALRAQQVAHLGPGVDMEHVAMNKQYFHTHP